MTRNHPSQSALDINVTALSNLPIPTLTCDNVGTLRGLFGVFMYICAELTGSMERLQLVIFSRMGSTV